ncbi:hypothetical protein QQ008_29710 [Fulvivirgaceae bacterium BMA10]|uniref:Uncharacterized protein n=1 Tax=Splendidivirga corallicola TaxID=3051826 RepID=A0ABT8KZP4_9BACT|nr:hypothetical protein [Fulvivirgaceae bacterium BMA10]
MSIVESVKNYFNKNESSETTDQSPEGVCPNCWGIQEWDGQFYKLMKEKGIRQGSAGYNSFIQEFVTKYIDGISYKKSEDSYICETCKAHK